MPYIVFVRYCFEFWLLLVYRYYFLISTVHFLVFNEADIRSCIEPEVPVRPGSRSVAGLGRVDGRRVQSMQSDVRQTDDRGLASLPRIT